MIGTAFTIFLYKIENMKKLLRPVEGGHYAQELLDFVGVLQQMIPLLLTTAFVPESAYVSMALLRQMPASAPHSWDRDDDRVIRYNRGRLEAGLANSIGH